MFPHAIALTSSDLQSAVIRDPTTVSPDTTVLEAIAQMNGALVNPSPSLMNRSLTNLSPEAQSNCAVVVEDGHIAGILTEQDVVRLIAQQQPLEQMMVRQAMTPCVITCRESELTDLLFIVTLFQQHQIRFLPVLDNQDRLLGLITQERLWQLSQARDLVRLRRVAVQERLLREITQRIRQSLDLQTTIVPGSDTDRRVDSSGDGGRSGSLPCSWSQ